MILIKELINEKFQPPRRKQSYRKTAFVNLIVNVKQLKIIRTNKKAFDVS